MVEVIWGMSGDTCREVRGGENTVGKGQACDSCEWRTGVNGSTDGIGRQFGSILSEEG